jgi:hypothetical protein
MQLKRTVIRQGFMAGLIGAGAVAIWFLLVDIIAGRVFFTPALLGSAVFWGVRDAADTVISFQTVGAYTVIHGLAFVIVGVIVSWLLSDAERDPNVLVMLLQVFIGLEFGFHAISALMFTSFSAPLAWFNVAIANLIAASSMGYYFWQKRLVMHRGLFQSPLDDEISGQIDKL